MENEDIRLASFQNYPGIAVDVRLLAASGFYYAGFQEEVKCFR